MNPVLRVYLFVAASALFGLLWLVTIVLKTIGRKNKISFFDLLLAFLATILPLLTLVFNNMGDTVPVVPLARLAVLGIAAIELVASAVFMLVESRREQRLRQSRGVLGAWAALLLIVSTFTVPLVSAQLRYIPGQTTLVAASGAIITDEAGPQAADGAEDATVPRGTPTLIPTNTLTPTATLTATPTVTRTPRPTYTPTMTLIGLDFDLSGLDTRTPTVTPTAVNPCLVVVNYNLRIRAQPNGDADTLAVIPFGTNVTAFGRNDDSTWWYVTYDGQSGWIDGQYADASSACDALPVKDVN